MIVENMIIQTTNAAMDSPLLNQWLPLKALGGNSVLIRKRSTRIRQRIPLIMFPRIEEWGYELWFHSVWYDGMIMLTEVDAWEKCPMEQYWPKCMWCNRFHLPFEGSGSHRNSSQHRRFRANQIDPIVQDPDETSRRQRAASLRATTQQWAEACGTDTQWLQTLL